MKQSELLKDWSSIKIEGYCTVGKKIIFESGQSIYIIGDPSECIYFIL
jgi:hypothetical protein